MLGAVHPVIVCQQSSVTVDPCPAGTAPAVTNAFLIDPSAQGQFEASFAPVDFAQAGSFWAIAFVVVVSLWSLSQIFSHFRRAIR